MKIKFLGTSDGFGIPSLFCNCEICKNAKTNKKKDLRTPSQILINEDLLIDFPPQSLCHQNTFDVDFSKIKSLLITNNSPSKLHPQSLISGSADNISHPLSPIQIFGSMPAIDLIFDTLRKSGVNNQNRWILNEIAPFSQYTIDDYKVTPLKANYEFRSFPYLYDIETRCGKRVLIAYCTGKFLKETTDYLNKTCPHYNLVILDCTEPYGKTCEQSFFMNIDDCRITKDILIKNNHADNCTQFILTHFSHKNCKNQEQLENDVVNDNFIIAYDGLEISI